MEIVDVITMPDGKTSYTYEDIENMILAVASKHMIDQSDIVNIKMPRWQAILIETGKILFPTGTLKRIGGKHHEYEFDVVSKLSDVYIFLCNKYNKMVTLYAFSMFVNMPYETLKQWEEGTLLNGVAIDTKQKINGGMSGSIINKLYDSNNVTGQMMLANNLLGWNTSRSTAENTIRHESIATIENDFLELGIETGGNVVQIDEKPDE